MDEPALTRLLASLTSSDPGRFERSLGATAPTLACVPLSRLRSGILKDNWTEAERGHLASCAYCRKTEQTARSQVWHPSLLQLFWHARNLSDNDADAAYHLQKDSCRRCQRLASLLSADRILTRLAGQVRAGIQNASNALGKALASGAVAAFALNSAGPGNVRFAFEDGKHALIVSSADASRVRVEVPAAPDEAPNLVRILVGSVRGTSEHLVVPRPSQQPSVRLAEFILPIPPSETASLALYNVDVSLLAPEDAAELRKGFSAAAKLDPPSVAAWQKWAAQSLQGKQLDPVLRSVLEAFSRADSGKHL